MSLMSIGDMSLAVDGICILNYFVGTTDSGV